MQCDPKISYQVIIDDISKDIFSWELTEIIEVTYIYKSIEKGNYFNVTLFQNFAWIAYKKDMDFEILGYTCEQKLQLKIELIDFYIGKIKNLWIENICNLNDKARLKLLIDTLKYVQNTLNMALDGLPFELEKAWHNHTLTDIEIQKRIENINDYETSNFGWNIHKNEEETIACYEYLRKRMKQMKSKEKQEELEYFTKKIEWYLPADYEYEYKDIPQLKKTDPILKTLIKRDDYVEIFNLIFSAYGLDQKAKVTQVSSIYDGETFLEIPDSDAYKEKTIASIFQLMMHEVMAHTVNLENTKRRLWNFRGANNLEKEEWLAMLLEELFQWNKIEYIGIVKSFPTLLLWEICTTEEFKKFLALSYPSVEPRFLRFKRNYPKNYTGVQHKDTTYTRGILKAVKYLENGWDLADLFLWKVSFEDIPALKKMSMLDPTQTQVYPLIITELLLLMIKNKGEASITFDHYIAYLEKKYHFHDMSFIEVEYRKPETKRVICDILKILAHYIPDLDEDRCMIAFY